MYRDQPRMLKLCQQLAFTEKRLTLFGSLQSVVMWKLDRNVPTKLWIVSKENLPKPANSDSAHNFESTNSLFQVTFGRAMTGV